MFVGFAEATVGYGFKMVSVTLADTAGFALLVAVTLTVFGLGNVAGGVYRPPVDVIEPAPVAGVSVQFTLVDEVPVTRAANCRNVPTCTDAGEGETVTAICAYAGKIVHKPARNNLFPIRLPPPVDGSTRLYHRVTVFKTRHLAGVAGELDLVAA
jgi:hypothetical protein